VLPPSGISYPALVAVAGGYLLAATAYWRITRTH